MNIAIAALMPHPPILVPAVGRERLADVNASLAAMREISREILATEPDTIVLISPHSPRSPFAFGVWNCAELRGTFAPFNAPDAGVVLPVDGEFVQALAEAGPRAGVQISGIPAGPLDHGAAVPLWFLVEAGWNGPTVVIALNSPGAGGIHGIGHAIAMAADSLGKKIAVVASNFGPAVVAPNVTGNAARVVSWHLSQRIPLRRNSITSGLISGMSHT